MPSTGAEQNVLFVVMDTVRKDHLSVYGYDRPTTPGLVDFAEEATVFEQAVAPAPWTLPVHASMFTGQYPSEHGASQENPYLRGSTTLAESLSATHATACYSSNAWITPYTGLTAGFDDQDNFFGVMPDTFLAGPLAWAWRALNDHDRLRAVADRLVELGNLAHEYFASSQTADSKTPRVIDRTIDFIDTHDDYFAFINLMDAHLPYHPPKQYRDEFAPGVDATSVCQNSKEYNCGARDIDDDEWEAIRGLYDAEIRHIDAELTRLFAWMRANDEWDDTLVIVCADHGELHGEHGLYGHEFCIYEPLINVPLLVKSPALRPTRRDVQIELQDLYHTVLDATDTQPAPDAVPLDPTRSLLSEDSHETERDYAFVEYYQPVVELQQLESKAEAADITLNKDSRFYSRMRASRTPNAKYIENERIPDEFYNLTDDPHETTNRLATDEETAAEYHDALAAFTDRVGAEWGAVTTDDVLADMSGSAQNRLRDLGYLE